MTYIDAKIRGILQEVRKKKIEPLFSKTKRAREPKGRYWGRVPRTHTKIEEIMARRTNFQQRLAIICETRSIYMKSTIVILIIKKNSINKYAINIFNPKLLIKMPIIDLKYL